ncbi:MAG: histone deacetylase [Chitinivibrionales bacterium]|nr:histone deacetylase [Chitinivibrionales bacterium]
MEHDPEGGVMSGVTHKTGFVYDEKYRDHILTPGHPESPERLAAIRDKMARDGLDDKVVWLSPERDMAGIRKYVSIVHSQDHYNSLNEDSKTHEIAMLSAGGALAGIDAVFSGKCENVFCALRPPGHHAHNNGIHYDGRNQGEGFCFINNIAVAARYAQHAYPCSNILIIDWDIHHGNGTEWAFYDDPSVFYFSTHVFWMYPGTGDPGKTGRGPGDGYTLNCPLEPYSGDREVLDVWNNVFVPSLEKTGFRPDLVMISAGFDSRENDLLGNLRITDSGFAEMTRIALDIAGKYCKGRLVSVLEGGYNPAGLADAVCTHVNTLLTT